MNDDGHTSSRPVLTFILEGYNETDRKKKKKEEQRRWRCNSPTEVLPGARCAEAQRKKKKNSASLEKQTTLLSIILNDADVCVCVFS